MNLYMDLIVNIIVHNYFLNSRCIILLTDEFNPINYIGKIPVINVNVELASENIPTDVIFHNFGCQEVVIKSDRPLWIFKLFEREIKLGMERLNHRKYLFLPGINTTENLTDVFNLEEIQYVSDLLVVEECELKTMRSTKFFQNEEVTYNFWTHKYVGNADNNQKLLLDKWFSKNQSFAYNRNLYPNKLRNQMGRELKMATFQYEPYSIIDSTIEDSQGSEMLTSIMFAKKLNMTPVAVVNPEDYWGEIYDNWTGNGLLGNLATDKADIGFAALYTWEVDYHFLDLTKPLVRTGITCLVPAPRLAPGWLTPLYSYSYAMWIAVGVVFTVCIISLTFIRYFYTHAMFKDTISSIALKSTSKLFGQSVFSIIKLFILQPITKEEMPTGFNGSYLMSLVLLLSLFLTSTYSSGLSSIMTIPRYENSIDTVEDFAASGLYWGGTQDAWITSIQNVEEPIYQAIRRHFISTSEENLREYSRTRKFAFAIERLPHEDYAIGSYIRDDVIGSFLLMKEDFYWEQCVIMTRKNSILLDLLDTFILQMFEAGLISHWQNEATRLYMDDKVQKAVKFSYYGHNNEHKVVRLQWTHVEGAFGILCVGYVISFIVFLVEISFVKLKFSSLTKKNMWYVN